VRPANEIVVVHGKKCDKQLNEPMKRLVDLKAEVLRRTDLITAYLPSSVGRCVVVGSTLAFGSIGHGFESEHRLFSDHGASAFSKLRSLAKCSLDDSVRRLL